MTVSQAVAQRRSMRSFDPNAAISRTELLDLLDAAIPSPSALNLQPWEFLICLEREDKERLRTVAFDQQKLADASAAVVVLAKLALYERLSTHPSANCFPASERDEWSRLATWAYADQPTRQRDEAFRSCSLFAMTFMLLAEEAGWATAPVGGFDSDALAAEFDIPPTHLPVLIVAIGRPGTKPPIEPRARRVPASELSHEGRHGQALDPTRAY